MALTPSRESVPVSRHSDQIQEDTTRRIELLQGRIGASEARIAATLRIREESQAAAKILVGNNEPNNELRRNRTRTEPGTAALPPGPLQRQPRGQLRTLRGSYIASAILAVPDLIRTRALVCFEPHPSRCVTDAQP